MYLGCGYFWIGLLDLDHTLLYRGMAIYPHVTGANLAGATGVSFGGTSATTITNVVATSLKATVPAGAQTGALQITNPAGTGGCGDGTQVFENAMNLSFNWPID